MPGNKIDELEYDVPIFDDPDLYGHKPRPASPQSRLRTVQVLMRMYGKSPNLLEAEKYLKARCGL